MIIRAQNLAGRELDNLGLSFGNVDKEASSAAKSAIGTGVAVTAIGVATAAVGAGILKFFNDAAGAAAKYQGEAALALTQVQGFKTSVQELEDIGRQVAKDIPVPLEATQRALYEIFSATNANLAQSKVLLQSFAQASVAGNEDIQAVSKTTIGIMNAYHIPFEQVNSVLDVMFQMVRNGQGHFQDFNDTLGRALPAAVAAHQSLEELAGTMAFLTRNGATAAASATEFSRATEMLVKDKAVTDLKKLGVAVFDATGNLRPLNQIISDLANNPGFQKLEASEGTLRAINDTLGSGTIQGRRFFDVAIPGFQQYNDTIGRMIDSKGAMEDAYKTMLDTPVNKIQLLKNQWDILKTSIGDVVLRIRDEAIPVINKLLDFFNSLSPSTLELIVKIGLAVGAFLLIAGIVIAVVGVFMMLEGAAALLGTSLLAITGVGLLVVAAIAAIVAIGYLLVSHWSDVKRIAGEVWSYVDTIITNVWHDMQNWAQNTINFLQGIWKNIQAAWAVLMGYIMAGWMQVHAFFTTELDWLEKWWRDHLEAINTVWNATWTVMSTLLSDIWTVMQGIIQMAWGAIQIAIQAGLLLLQVTWTVAWDVIKGVFSTAWNIIRDTAQNVWNVIKAIIDLGIHAVMDNIGIVLDIITGHWGQAWKDIEDLGNTAWKDIKTIVSNGIAAIVTAIDDFGHGVANFLYQAGKDLIKGFVNGIKDSAGSVTNALGDIASGGLKALKGSLGLSSPSRVFHEIGVNTAQGLINGLNSMAPYVAQATVGMMSGTSGGSSTSGSLRPVGALSSQGPGLTTTSHAINIHEGAVKITVDTGGAPISDSSVNDIHSATMAALQQLVNEVKDGVR